MVRFEEYKLIVEIESTDPINDWLNIQEEIYDLLRLQQKESEKMFYWLYLFLQDFRPDYESASRMIERKEEAVDCH